MLLHPIVSAWSYLLEKGHAGFWGWKKTTTTKAKERQVDPLSESLSQGQRVRWCFETALSLNALCWASCQWPLPAHFTLKGKNGSFHLCRSSHVERWAGVRRENSVRWGGSAKDKSGTVQVLSVFPQHCQVKPFLPSITHSPVHSFFLPNGSFTMF